MRKTKFITKIFKAMSLKRRSIISLHDARNTEGRKYTIEFWYNSFSTCRANDFKLGMTRIFVNDNENIYAIRIWSTKIDRYFVPRSARYCCVDILYVSSCSLAVDAWQEMQCFTTFSSRRSVPKNQNFSRSGLLSPGQTMPTFIPTNANIVGHCWPLLDVGWPNDPNISTQHLSAYHSNCINNNNTG